MKEICRCGHLGDKHSPLEIKVSGIVASEDGHGACTAEGCSCKQFRQKNSPKGAFLPDNLLSGRRTMSWFAMEIPSQISPPFKGKWVYSCMEEFVLLNGRLFTQQREVKVDRRRFRDKWCFRNSYMLATERKLTYVEGFAWRFAWPMPGLHAWCVDKEDNIYDPTWGIGDHEYFGIEFDLTYVAKVLLETNWWGVIDNLEGGLPLLKGKDKWAYK